MNLRLLWACLLCAVVGTLLVAGAVAAAEERLTSHPSSKDEHRLRDRLDSSRPQQSTTDYETVTWEALLQKGWNPSKLLEEMKLEELQDNDPRARDVMRKITEMWQAAPVNPDLDQHRIRIAGFVVPLEGDRSQLREFLLVPYFGACLHLPPPPANQIVHVVVPRAAKPIDPSGAAWVSGTLRIEKVQTKLATTGYKMVADSVEPLKREWSPF